MEDNKIRDLAKKILHVQSFQELHDIIMVYANDELEFVEFPDSLSRYERPVGKSDIPDGFSKYPIDNRDKQNKKLWPTYTPDPAPEFLFPDNDDAQKSLDKFRDLLMP